MTSIILPRFNTSNGIACHRAGTGKPVVLLHGVGLRGEAWIRQIEALAERQALYVLDLPGHGGSTPLTESNPPLADYTDRIAEGLGELIDEPAIIVGHSMGAMIAIDLAVRHPDLCRGIAALNGVFRRTKDAKRAVLERAETLASSGRMDVGVQGALTRWFGDDPAGRDRQSAELCRTWLTGMDSESYARAYTAFARHDGPGDAALASLNLPMLFLTGELDPNSTPSMSRAMADLAPKGRSETIPGAAHMAPMTHADRVNAALLRFVEDVTALTDREASA